MDFIQTIILALIQGISEFLPISSSAHLILPSQILGWPDQGLAFDVAVHVGTLIAVLIYFREDVFKLVSAWLGQFVGRGQNDDSRLAWFIGIATIPAGFLGLIMSDFIEQNLRSMDVIAATTLIFGALLWLADVKNRQEKSLKDMTIILAVIIGLAQAIALVPGTSRSGITITSALFLGFTRVDAAKFSFLLSIPIILLSGGYKGMELVAESQVDWANVILGVCVSGVSAYVCIYWFFGIINRMSMLPFVIYRFALGSFLLGVSLGLF